jgi:hypothetical protein
MEAEFTNSATKQPMTIYANLVFGVTYLPTTKTTALISIGGQLVPVEGTPEEAKEKIRAAKDAANNPKESK